MQTLIQERRPLDRQISMLLCLILAIGCALKLQAQDDTNEIAIPLDLAGISITPHVATTEVRFKNQPTPDNGAWVQLFIRNTSTPDSPGAVDVNPDNIHFGNREPSRYVNDGDWAWYDMPSLWTESKNTIPPGSITVWSFNTMGNKGALPKVLELEIADWTLAQKKIIDIPINQSRTSLAAVNFLGLTGNPQPDNVVLSIFNDSDQPQSIKNIQLYLPSKPENPHVFYPFRTLTNLTSWPQNGVIPPHEKGLCRINTGPLPLTYAVIRVQLQDDKAQTNQLWSMLRIHKIEFDISGGWVSSGEGTNRSILQEPYLQLLQRMHINTAHLQSEPGYTDQNGPTGLYTRFPLKYFGAMNPLAEYDTDVLLRRIHAVEFLGEPQLENSPQEKSPQEVLAALYPYTPSRLATSVTLNNPKNWCAFAGVSDYPHFDAYRVCSPAADDWNAYTRWEGKAAGWAAPLETMGDMCRSLRETSRPRPIACWTQGPHFDWDSVAGRKRTSPTPDELRMQAWHALASRVTSLYWFNLNLKSLAKYRDLISPIQEVDREIKTLEPLLIEGDSYSYQRVFRNNLPDWDCTTLISPRGALMVALDLDYTLSRQKQFEFKDPRPMQVTFKLPIWLQNPVDVFRIDARGIYNVAYTNTTAGIQITDRQCKTTIYVASMDNQLRGHLENVREKLMVLEQSYIFNPASEDKDYKILKSLANSQ